MIKKLVRLGQRSQIVLPKEVRKVLYVREGNSVVFVIRGDSVSLMNPDEAARKLAGRFSGTWGKTKQEVDRYLSKERSSWQRGNRTGS